MKKVVVLVSLMLLLLCGTAEAGVGDVFKNAWSYVAGFVTCGIERAGALVSWVVDTGTCAIAKLNKNPATLQPLVPVLPTDPAQ